MVFLARSRNPENGRAESIMVLQEACPQCGPGCYERNGHIHTGKKNHRYKVYGRAFVFILENHFICHNHAAFP
jgi:hypothetical protein